MVALIELENKQILKLSKRTEANPVDNSEVLRKAELRRQMYERIAQGNALSELEDKASHQWNK